MKKILAVLSLLPLSLFSQCPMTNSQATNFPYQDYCATIDPDTTVSYFCPGGGQGSTGWWLGPGQFQKVQVFSGYLYTFSTCASDWDTYLSIIDLDSNELIFADNDDYCGLQSTVSWIATFNGTVGISVKYNCESPSPMSCASLSMSRISKSTHVGGVNQDEIKIYPVPAENHLTVEVPSGFFTQKITISDLSGQIVYLDFPRSDKINIDVTNITSGVYTINAQNQFGKYIVSKFIKN